MFSQLVLWFLKMLPLVPRGFYFIAFLFMSWSILCAIFRLFFYLDASNLHLSVFLLIFLGSGRLLIANISKIYTVHDINDVVHVLVECRFLVELHI